MLHYSFFLLFLVKFDGFSLNKRYYIESQKKKKKKKGERERERERENLIRL